MLIVNADDLGKTPQATDNILSCFRQGLVTSASAMVFMSDSVRAAELAAASRLESGLHLNLDLPFSGRGLPPRLRDHHSRIVHYLRRGKWTQVLYNPSLKSALRYVYESQYAEFCRLFGREPTQIDGHDHMHLCLNVIMDRIIPIGMTVRRNFSFAPGEKSLMNRLYRRLIDAWLVHRYVCTDAFFSIEPVSDLPRLERIIRMACSRNVELMVHPEIREQYDRLLSPEYRALLRAVPAGTYRMLSKSPAPSHLGPGQAP